MPVDEIALTRRVEAVPGDLRRVVAATVIRPRLRPAAWQARAWGLVGYVAGGAFGIVLSEAPAWPLLLPVALALAAGLEAVEIGVAAWAVWSCRRRALRPGAVVEAGVAPGVLRVSDADSDCVYAVGPEVEVVDRGRLVELVSHPDAVQPWLLLTGLLTPDDVALLRHPPPMVLPRRSGGGFPETKGLTLDERWRGRVGRASVRLAASKPLFWVHAVATALVVGVALALLTPGTAWTSVLAALLLVVTSCLVGSYRHGARVGAVPAGGVEAAAGAGPAGLRTTGPGYDLLQRRGSIRSARVRGDVLHVRLDADHSLLIPGEVVDVRALDEERPVPA